MHFLLITRTKYELIRKCLSEMLYLLKYSIRLATWKLLLNQKHIDSS
jgi:hypothetical protein